MLPSNFLFITAIYGALEALPGTFLTEVPLDGMSNNLQETDKLNFLAATFYYYLNNNIFLLFFNYLYCC